MTPGLTEQNPSLHLQTGLEGDAHPAQCKSYNWVERKSSSGECVSKKERRKSNQPYCTIGFRFVDFEKIRCSSVLYGVDGVVLQRYGGPPLNFNLLGPSPRLCTHKPHKPHKPQTAPPVPASTAKNLHFIK